MDNQVLVDQWGWNKADGQVWNAIHEGFWCRVYSHPNLIFPDKPDKVWSWVMKGIPLQSETQWFNAGFDTGYRSDTDAMDAAMTAYRHKIMDSDYHRAVQNLGDAADCLEYINPTMQFQFYSSRGEAKEDLIELVRTPMHDAIRESGKLVSLPSSFWMKAGMPGQQNEFTAHLGHMETAAEELFWMKVEPMRRVPVCTVWSSGMFSLQNKREMGQILVRPQIISQIGSEVANITRYIAWAWIEIYKGGFRMPIIEEEKEDGGEYGRGSEDGNEDGGEGERGGGGGEVGQKETDGQETQSG